MEHRLTQKDAIDFIFGGAALFTVRDTEKGTRYTYKIAKSKSNKEDKPPLFVRVLSGSDNTKNYTFLGTIFGESKYQHSKKSKAREDAPSVRAIKWLLNRLVNQTLPDKIEIWHEGVCCRCGRSLTVPESIESGYGPECVKHRKHRVEQTKLVFNQIQ